MFGKNKKVKEEKAEELEPVEKVEEKKKDDEDKPSLKKSFNMYKFILKILIAVILITFGIIMLIKKQDAIFILILMSGAITTLTALIRGIGLFKKDKTPEAKKIQAILCVIHLIIGVYLIIAAVLYNNDYTQNGNNLNDFSKFNRQYYPLFMAVVLYVQAVMFFWQTVLYKAETTKFMFWLHIIYITLAVVLAYLVTGGGENDIAGKVVVTIAVIALVLALFTAGEALFGYFNYRKYLNRDKKSKSEETKDEDQIEAPTTDESVDIEIIDPQNDNNDAPRVS
ncbi:MAG: hypothetical protein IJU60_01565 [Acholeplasmatales bacterium]|nr:hypothetical protein [Acholeplasmatales bacterium]